LRNITGKIAAESKALRRMTDLTMNLI
jgi:hypothetical protein